MTPSLPVVLKDIIEQKKKANRRISLRSIAARIGIPSGRLSEILSGKRRMTEVQLDKICNAFKLEQEDVVRLRTAYQRERNVQGPMPKRGTKDSGYGELLLNEQIEKLLNWKPYAIMTFLQTISYQTLQISEKQQHIELIAKRLSLDVTEVSQLLQVMSEKNLLLWDGQRWTPIFDEATTGYDIPSKLIQDSHAQDLILAQKKLETTDVARRDFSSITLALDPNDMIKAKKLIRNFRRLFARTLEKGEKREVFQISIQFFPLTESAD